MIRLSIQSDEIIKLKVEINKLRLALVAKTSKPDSINPPTHAERALMFHLKVSGYVDGKSDDDILREIRQTGKPASHEQ